MGFLSRVFSNVRLITSWSLLSCDIEAKYFVTLSLKFQKNMVLQCGDYKNDGTDLADETTSRPWRR